MQAVGNTYWDAGKSNLTDQNTRKPFGGRGSAPDPAEGQCRLIQWARRARARAQGPQAPGAPNLHLMFKLHEIRSIGSQANH